MTSTGAYAQVHGAQAALRAALSAAPERAAVDDGGRITTFRELDEQAGAVATAVVQRRGDRLEPAVVLTRDALAYARAAVGCFRAGRTLVPLDPAHPVPRLRAVLSMLDPSAIIVSHADRDLAVTLARPGDDVVVLEEVLAAGTVGTGWLDRDPTSLARITFTSGSTGRPKGVPRDHSAIKGPAGSDGARPRPGDRVPVTFSGARTGVGADPLRIVLSQATILPFDLRGEGVARYAAWLPGSGATAIELVPTVLRHIAGQLPEGVVLPDLRLVRTAGETLYWEDVHRLRRHLSPECAIWFVYGASEAGVVARYEVPDLPDATGVVPIGTPVAGVTVRVVGDDGEELAVGQSGELVISGRPVAPRYLGGEASDRFWVDPVAGPTYRTGDRGRVGPDGLLTHLGREDGMVKIHGQRVELAEVAGVLLTHEQVREADVQAFTGASGDRELVAFVGVPDGGLAAADLRAHVRATLPTAAVPGHVQVVPELPRLPGGKVDRAALQRAWSERPGIERLQDEEAAFVVSGPRDDVAIMVRETVERLSGIRVPDARTSLLELGVDSIHLAGLFAAIESRFGVDLPISSVVDHPTPAALARLVHEGEGSWPVVVPVRTSGTSTPLFVVHGGRGNVVYAWPLGEILGPERPVYAVQHPALDGYLPAERSVADLAARYAEAILELRPDGPYAFAGMSGGGVLAFETARVLRAEGREVEVVVMFDTASLPGRDDAPPERPPRRPWRHPWRRRRALARHVLTAWDLRVRGRLRPALRPSWVMGWVVDTFGQHRMTPLDVNVVLARATGGAPVDPSDDRGWSRWAPTEVVAAEGRHGQMMRPPNLVPNGRILAAALERYATVPGAKGR